MSRLVGTLATQVPISSHYVSLGAPLPILSPSDKELLACCFASAFRAISALCRGHETRKSHVLVEKHSYAQTSRQHVKCIGRQIITIFFEQLQYVVILKYQAGEKNFLFFVAFWKVFDAFEAKHSRPLKSILKQACDCG